MCPIFRAPIGIRRCSPSRCVDNPELALRCRQLERCGQRSALKHSWQRSPGPMSQMRAKAAPSSSTSPCVIVVRTSSTQRLEVILRAMRSHRVGLYVWEITVKGATPEDTNAPCSEHYLSGCGAIVLLPLHPNYLIVFRGLQACKPRHNHFQQALDPSMESFGHVLFVKCKLSSCLGLLFASLCAG